MGRYSGGSFWLGAVWFRQDLSGRRWLSFDSVKYRLAEQVVVNLPVAPVDLGMTARDEHTLPSPIESSRKLVWLAANVGGGADMVLRPGFSWDGCSGPCPDRGLLVASAVHDALYTLIRSGALPASAREAADHCFYLLAKRSVPSWWAWVAWKALLLFGRRALWNPRPVLSVRVR